MALPDKPLDVDIDPDKTTVGDMVLLSGEFEGSYQDFVKAVRSFITEHTNWTARDIDRVTMTELQDVIGMIGDSFINGSLGEASAPASETGQPATPTEAHTTTGGEQAGDQPGTTTDASDESTG